MTAPNAAQRGTGTVAVPSRHSVDPTTRTLEMTQIRDINAHLSRKAEALRAGDLGLAELCIHLREIDSVACRGAHVRSHSTSSSAADLALVPEAPLRRLVAAGSPLFPYIYGLFGEAGPRGGEDETRPLTPVPLHTAQLRRISAGLGLRQHWGV
jgi:hypothetical protein